MKAVKPNPALLAVALALLLPAGTVIAKDPAPKPAAAPKAQSDERELAAARADLARAAARVAELTRPQAEEAVRIARRFERKPVIGVVLTADEQAGVRIAGVTPDSAAAKAGLRSGDRLVSVDGSSILGSDGELRVANARKLLSRIDGRQAGPPRLRTRRPQRHGRRRRRRSAITCSCSTAPTSCATSI